MGLTTGSRIIGNQVFFVREGASFTVPSAGTAGRAAKPGAADASWVNVGIVDDLKFTHDRDTKEVFAPLPGQRRLYDLLETKRKLSASFTGKELSALVIELLFGTLALTSASTQFNPLEGVTKKGWLKVQQYDQADVLVNTLDIYGVLSVKDVNFNDDVVSPPFEFVALHSTLNTGTL